MTVKDRVQEMVSGVGVRAVHVWAGRQPVVDEPNRMYEALEAGIMDRSGVLSCMEEIFPEGVSRKLDGSLEYIRFPDAGRTCGFTVRKVI